MIQYHAATVPLSQEVFKGAIHLLAETFGEMEAELEWLQLNGCEVSFNQDVLFWAQDDQTIIGILHLTVPGNMPKIGALSGFCVLKQYRGSGIGKKLMSLACSDFDRRGGETLFLGTDNPAASHLYRQFGFAYENGCNIMYRTKASSLAPFYASYLAGGNIRIEPASAVMRIPIIPLVMQRGRDVLMDANTSIVSNAVLTQHSCMGLYPRYLQLIEKGGSVLCAANDKGLLCGVASVRQTAEHETFVDAFTAPGFESVVLDLLQRCCHPDKSIHACLADADGRKADDFSSFGFVKTNPTIITHNTVNIPCHLWTKPAAEAL